MSVLKERNKATSDPISKKLSWFFSLPQRVRFHSPQAAEYRLPTAEYRLPTFSFLLLFFFTSAAYPSDAEVALDKMQHRYASADTIHGSFVLTTNPIPGIDKVEKGVFWLKKPALMRWEYSYPEEKLLIADGKKAFFYEPYDNQVSEYSWTTDELLDTPLKFLLGLGDIPNTFFIVSEEELGNEMEGLKMIRLIPRAEADYSSLVLGIDDESSDLLRLIVIEHSGDKLEYSFSDLKIDVKIKDKDFFKFEIPEGAEVDRQ